MTWFDPTIGAAVQATGTAVATGLTPDQQARAATPEARSARATIERTLADYGLPASLAATLWDQWYVRESKPIAQVLLDLETTSEYKARFPGLQMLKERANRGEAVYIPSVSEYIQLEAGIASVLSDAGIPKGQWDDPSDYGRFIGGSNSPKEVEDRINAARAVAFSAPVQVREELNRVYGIEAGELVAFWLDPDKALPDLQKKALAATVGGAAKRVGFGLLTQSEMENLSGSGVTGEVAEQRFGQLAESAALFEETVEETTDLGRAEQIAFAGGEAPASLAIERRRKARQARFAGGGGAAGIGGPGSGLGSAQ